MSVRLIHATCVKHETGEYLMKFWADNVDECVAPGTMSMVGGSTAIVTGDNGTVTHYRYNSANNVWEVDANGVLFA